MYEDWAVALLIPRSKLWKDILMHVCAFKNEFPGFSGRTVECIIIIIIMATILVHKCLFPTAVELA